MQEPFAINRPTLGITTAPVREAERNMENEPSPVRFTAQFETIAIRYALATAEEERADLEQSLLDHVQQVSTTDPVTLDDCHGCLIAYTFAFHKLAERDHSTFSTEIMPVDQMPKQDKNSNKRLEPVNKVLKQGYVDPEYGEHLRRELFGVGFPQTLIDEILEQGSILQKAATNLKIAVANRDQRALLFKGLGILGGLALLGGLGTFILNRMAQSSLDPLKINPKPIYPSNTPTSRPTSTATPRATNTEPASPTATKSAVEKYAGMSDAQKINMYPNASAELGEGNILFPSELKPGLIVKLDKNGNPIDVYNVFTGQREPVEDIHGAHKGSRGKDWTPFGVQFYRAINGDVVEFPFSGLVAVPKDPKDKVADYYFPVFDDAEDLVIFLRDVEGAQWTEQQINGFINNHTANIKEVYGFIIGRGFDHDLTGDFTFSDGKTRFNLFAIRFNEMRVFIYMDRNKVSHFAILRNSTLPNGMTLQQFLNTVE